MEVNLKQNEQAGDDEDYVLLDLDSVCVQADIPANTPYVLSGLDTLNPVLTIGNHLKLIGEYQETIGTCYVFSERDGVPKVLHPETDPSETNLPKDTSTIKSTQVPTKEVKLITSLHRVLKFRLASQDESQAAIRSNAETMAFLMQTPSTQHRRSQRGNKGIKGSKFDDFITN